MSRPRTDPDSCRTMVEVREGVDQLDVEIVRLLGERFRYMDAAARIKEERASVRDEARKAKVIANARRNAAAAGVPPELAEEIWERLVEASIAFEFERFDEMRR